jgi:hypothetical protein
MCNTALRENTLRYLEHKVTFAQQQPFVEAGIHVPALSTIQVG